MIDINYDLKLLKGSPIELKGIGWIHPLTCGDISEIGMSKYNEMLKYLLFEKKTIQLGDESISSFIYMLLSCYQDETFRNEFIGILSLIFKDSVHINENGFLYLGDILEVRYITEEVYDQIRNIIKKQNFIETEIEEESKPANDRVRELLEKMKNIKEKIKKENKEVGLDLSDIISIVSSYSSNLNIFNIWELTVYQLYTLYIRLMMKDSYEIEVQKWLQGADPKDLNLKHWASKLDNK